MPSEYLHSGEPLPLAPSLTGDSEHDVQELLAFHAKLLDYLRRLGAKLTAADIFDPPGADPVTTTAIEVLMLTLSTEYELAAGAQDTIEWDEVQRQDTPYGYAPSTGVITLIEAGFYIMFVDFYVPGVQVHTSRLIDGDSHVLPYGTTYYDGGAAATVLSESVMIPFAAHEGMTVEFQIVGGAAADVQSDSSRLIVMKLGDFIGSGGIDPCDGFDVWQLCP